MSSLTPVKNPSPENPRSWTEDGLTFTELIYQDYTNCRFSAGAVEGHPVDTIYFQAEKDGRVNTQILLRPDEAAAMAWVISGVLWSVLLGSLPDPGLC